MSQQSTNEETASASAPADSAHALRVKRRALAMLLGATPPNGTEPALLTALEWVPALRGETLFRQGEPVPGLYILVDGAMRLSHVDGDGTEIRAESLGEGAFPDAAALLAGESHYATARAVRDCDLCLLPLPAFHQFSQRNPELMGRVARQTVRRLQPGASPDTQPRRATVAVIAPVGDVDAAAFAARLAAALQHHGETLHLTAADATALLELPPGESPEESVDSYEFVDGLQELARRYRYLLYVADPAQPRWTQRCVEQADRILLVGRAGADPAPGAVEAIFAQMPHPDLLPPQELVLLHRSRSHNPGDTRTWLAARPVVRHHHVAEDTGFGLDRVSRFVRGRAIGLVLGGGGMRSAAGVGAVRVLAELGIRADVVGGTSAGAIAAALYATGADAATVHTTVRDRLMQRHIWIDPTLPLVSAMRGRRLMQAYREVFGELYMEDLWTTPFTISGNLTRAKMVVHRTGLLRHAVRASTSIAGIFPPALSDESELLIDGGVFNNTPADVARVLVDTGPVIAVDLGFTERPNVDYRYGEWLNGFRVLWNRINPFAETIATPSIVGIMMRANALGSINTTAIQTAPADLILRPPVGSYGLFDFDAYDTIVETGYEYAHREIRAWLEAGGLDGV